MLMKYGENDLIDVNMFSEKTNTDYAKHPLRPCLVRFGPK